MPPFRAHYCHACGAARGLLYPLPENPLATSYQMGKYAKHTVVDPTCGVQGIFTSTEAKVYKDYIVDSAVSISKARAVQALLMAMSMAPMRALSMRTCARRLPPASTTAMFTGQSMDLALALTASMRRRAVSRLTVSMFMHPSESAVLVRGRVIEGSERRIT